nr:hypothetical protein [Tanacetum cinerariifolium]
LVTKICHVLTTGKTVDDDEVAPRRNAVCTYKGPNQNLLTTRKMDGKDAPGLKAVLKNVRDIHGLVLAIVLERLNSHGAFQEVHDKTRATELGQL